MIIDTVENAAKYFSIHPLFEKAFEFIQSCDWTKMEVGKKEIEEGLNSIYIVGPGKTAAESLKKFECHERFIDIQYCVSGVETFGWKPLANCMKPNGEYNSEKDVRFYNDEPEALRQLKNGQFVIFFPADVHAPMIGEGEIKKMVVKVKI